MELEKRIETFSELGFILRSAVAGKQGSFTGRISDLISNQHLKNPWFTPGNMQLAIESIANELTKENLLRWTSAYPALGRTRKPDTIAVIMAGNIPLVGFHDMLSVLITGNKLIARMSSKDIDSVKLITEIIAYVNPSMGQMISLTESQVSDFDAIIATGSDNSARYFNYYFGKYPHIIRRNRNSVAVIDETETNIELEGLGNDIFSFFGLGCRSVSKIYIPNNYPVARLANAFDKYNTFVSHSKYANNYDFNKALYIVNRNEFIDTGYLLIKEDKLMTSPVSVLHFEYYSSNESLRKELLAESDRIQCIVGHGYLPFGKSQMPALWDYADGCDTLDFQLKNNFAQIL